MHLPRDGQTPRFLFIRCSAPGVLGALYGESQWSSGFGVVGNEESRGEIVFQPRKCPREANRSWTTERHLRPHQRLRNASNVFSVALSCITLRRCRMPGSERVHQLETGVLGHSVPLRFLSPAQQDLPSLMCVRDGYVCGK
jgi:hypothetical protein